MQEEYWAHAQNILSTWTEAEVVPLGNHHRILGWSERLERWTGLGPEAVLKRRIRQVFWDWPETSSEGQLPFEVTEIQLSTKNGRRLSGCLLGMNHQGVGSGVLWLRPIYREDKPQPDFHGIVTASPKMAQLFELVRRVGQADVTALVRGESGSGKELLARAIHMESPRRDKAFLAVNCATISPQLVNSELFGHKKGAFTGANSDHKGFFERADGGTLFLDEVGELPLSTQANLLRVLQEQSFTPVGGSRSIKVNVRIIAATNRALRKEVLAGRFREDLLYRIRILPLYLPPLRERIEDIPLLLKHFLIKENTGKRFSDETLALLMNYDWPGNIRELQNVVTYARILAMGTTIQRSDLPPEFQRVDPILKTVYAEQHVVSDSTDASSTEVVRTQDALPTDERSLVSYVLELTKGDIGRAAEMMGMSRSTFWRKRKSLGL